MTRVAVVLNGSAGALLDQPDAMETLKRQFAAAGLDPEFVPQDAGTLPERVKIAQRSGAAAVVAAGGDGTIACTAQVLAGTDTPMGVLPFGTMNLLAKDLGIPIGDTAGAVGVLAAMHTRAIDVGEVNGHVFLCASMLGLPARLARYREAGRGQRSGPRMWARMARATVRALARHATMKVALRQGDDVTRVDTTALTVTPNPIDERADHAFGRTTLDGGTLAIYQIGRLRLADMVSLGWHALRGRVGADAAVLEARATELTVTSTRRAMRVMNDGEVRLLRPPLDYRIRPGALRVVAPAPKPVATLAADPAAAP